MKLFPSPNRWGVSTDTWSSAPNLITARSAHTATLLPNGDVLIAGGKDEKTGPTNRVKVYRP